MTVRNEARALRDNLLYHRRAGVERVFLFDDASSDDTRATVSDLDFVETSPPVAPSESDRTLRQARNADAALASARRLGLDWLLHLDADELACPEPAHAGEGALAAFLAAFPATTLQVAFMTREVVQRRVEQADFFGGETLFKADPKHFSRRMPDPGSGGSFRLDGFYGHAMGKSAVRVSAPAAARDVHRFSGPGGSWLRTERRGLLLHYFVHDFRAFREKFAAYAGHADRYPTGAAVERQKLVWRDLAHACAEDETALRAYYERFLLYDPAEVTRLRRTRRLGVFPVAPAIVEISAPREAFLALRRLDRPAPAADNGALHGA
jgi:hypothetical protein